MSDDEKCDDSFRVHVPSSKREAFEHIAMLHGRKLSQWARLVLEERLTIEIHRLKLEGPKRHQ